MSGYFDDPGELAKLAAKHADQAQGAYITLNPLNPALLSRAANRIRVVTREDRLSADADVTRRCWLPIDLDPVRPSGISSSDEEHDAAVERAYKIREALASSGWPKPILADSGNGAHLLYRIDCDVQDNHLVSRVLDTLAFRFDDETVKVDRSVYNPARIWKLYGTVSRKGDYCPERPHRMAVILESAQ